MEQLWYTWSFNGPIPGFQIRATSRGLGEEDERTVKLLPFVRYRLPEGTHDIRPEEAPVALSFTDTGRYGHILIHKVYKLDGTGRPGAFFSHLVLLSELSKPFTMREAIDLWASKFWRDSESERDQRILPQVNLNDLAPSPTGPFEGFKISERPALERLLVSILLAFLTHENRQRLYMLAPSQVVIAIIWGLAHSLPRTLKWWNDITFTTYTDDVSKASEFIVGTSRFPTSSSQDLPEACYNGNMIAVNIDPTTFQIRRYFLPELSNHPLYREYASYAAGCLVNCSMKELSELVGMAEQQGIDNMPAFLDLYEKEIIGKPLSLDELLEAFGKKTANEEQLKKSKNQDLFVKAIRTTPGYWEGGARKALVAFCHRAENDQEASNIRSSLTQKVVAALATEAQNNNPVAFMYLLQVIVELAPVRKNESIWRDLLRYLSLAVLPFAPVATSILFPLPTRQLLLSQWVQIIQLDKDTEIHAWLKAAWGDLEELLGFVPPQWHKLVIYFRLAESGTIPPDAVASVAKVMQQFGDSLFRPVLVEYYLAQKISNEQVEAAGNFIEQSLILGFPLRLELLFDALVADRSGLITQRLNTTGANALQREDLFDFVQTYIPQLFQVRLLQPTVKFINTSINRYFDYHQAAEIVNRQSTILELISRLNREIQRAISRPEAAVVRALLVKKVVNTLQKMAQEHASATFFHLLQALQLIAPIGIDGEDVAAWKALLAFLPEPGQQFPWNTRELLLIQWAKIAKLIRENDISQWLNVYWGELERLFALTIPDEWQLLAIEKRIEDRAALPKEAKTVVQKYADGPFAQTLERYIANGSPTQAEAAVRFVKKLLQQSYPKRLSLLLGILIADKTGFATLQLSDDLNQDDDLFAFVENSLQKLMPYARRKHTAQFILQCLDLYFVELAPGDLVSHEPTKNLLYTLSQDSSFHLPEKLQARIRCWQEIARFLELGSSAANLKEVEAFTEALARTELTPNMCQQLNDTLAPILASHDFEDEQPELVNIIYLLGKALIGPAQLLENMAVVAGEEFGTSPSKVFPYIWLVLHDAHRLEGEMKALFLATSLNHLLKRIGSIDEPVFQKIQQRVSYLSQRDRDEWLAYLNKSRFAPVKTSVSPALPRRFFFPPYWKIRRIYENLRKTIHGRMTTEIAHASSLLHDYNYLTNDEKQMIMKAREFTEAYETNNDEKMVRLYQEIWEDYEGRLYFKPEELKRIRKAEEKSMARERADK